MTIYTNLFTRSVADLQKQIAGPPWPAADLVCELADLERELADLRESESGRVKGGCLKKGIHIVESRETYSSMGRTFQASQLDECP